MLKRPAIAKQIAFLRRVSLFNGMEPKMVGSDFEHMWLAGNQASMQMMNNLASSLAQRVRFVSQRYTDIFSKSDETIGALTKELEKLRGLGESRDEPDVDALG